MQEFLQIALNFPTAFFSLLLIVVLAYWVFVLLGALDLDLFDVDADIDADIDVDVDVDVDIDADVDVDADVDADADLDAGADGADGVGGALVSVLMALGWTGVPLTITMSIFIFLSWMTSFLGIYFAQQLLNSLPVIALKAGVTLSSLLISALITRVAIAPLRHALKTQVARKGADHFVGKTVKVTSSTVSPSSGRGNFVEADGVVMEVAIRCEDLNNALGRGDEALIIAYDADKHVYFVTPLGQLIQSPSAQTQTLSEEIQELEAKAQLEESVSQKQR